MTFFKNKAKEFFPVLMKAVKKPVLFLLLTFSLYLIFSLFNVFYPEIIRQQPWIKVSTLSCILKVANFAVLLCLIWRALYSLQIYFQNYAHSSKNTRLKILLPLISQGIRVLIILLLLNMIISSIEMNSFMEAILKKSTNLLMISLFGWLFFKLIHTVEKLILLQYGDEEENTFAIRKIKTQVLMLKRIILAIGYMVILSSFLLTFKSVHYLGAGLLTFTGLIGAIGAFASQQSLNRLFSGLQLAFTQPVRIGETVIIENETGTIEEISLFYIVIKLWDGRRLILPTDALMTKSLQNLSRTSTHLLGAVILQVDYTLPVLPLREKLLSILKESAFWDQDVGTLQVTDMHTSTMEIRALMSATDSGKLWNLRCEVREKLIAFIVEHYPHALPHIRNSGAELIHPE